MNINKRDKLSFFLALLINIVIVLLIPGYKIEDIKEGKLKVGLVALEKEKVYSKEQKKTVSAKKPVQKKEPVKKNTEIPTPKKEEIKKEKSLSLASVSKTIKAPSINIMNTKSLSTKKSNDLLSDALKGTKKEIKFEREEKRIFHNKTIRLPEDVIEKIDTIVQDKNISFNKVVLQLIEYALKDVE